MISKIPSPTERLAGRKDIIPNASNAICRRLSNEDDACCDVHPSVFTQGHIDIFPVALLHGLSSNQNGHLWTKHLVTFPALPCRLLPQLLPIQPLRTTQLADRGSTSFEVGGINLATEPGWSLARPKNRDHNKIQFLEYEDNYFEKFFSKDMVFESVGDVMVAIDKYKESSGNILSTTRTRGNARTFICVSHANCPFTVKFGSIPKQEKIIYKPQYCTVLHTGAIKLSFPRVDIVSRYGARNQSTALNLLLLLTNTVDQQPWA
ncbi:hypothetical protein IV203_013296 [Nitzschia inconspicua]|uniref:Uncharacterized protein n=1 Tax=Nitzschia inconspicua TaxID=303405 RepID=A0A9K3Q7Y9_9STRA|nr:hypothetical protein IV203_013296 [Nitzschia inconspicua]